MNITKKVLLETSEGNIEIGLYGDLMPISVENFLKYVEAGYYKNLIFHRVIEDFMIQGGGFMTGMLETNPIHPPIKLETSPEVKHLKYVLSMARTSDPNSATAQFFICTADSDFLDDQYAAFGMVTDGTDVVDKIGNCETKTVRGNENVPVNDVKIKLASVID